MAKPKRGALVDLLERFGNDEDARAHLEALRWPEGPVCPHCSSTSVYRLIPKATSKRPGRKGLLKCKTCRKQFTVTVSTVMEASHIPLSTWIIAVYLMTASKKGMSAHQLHRMLGLSYKTAWFLCHRLRLAMTDFSGEKLTGIIEADECYIGGKERGGKRGRPAITDKKVAC